MGKPGVAFCKQCEVEKKWNSYPGYYKTMVGDDEDMLCPRHPHVKMEPTNLTPAELNYLGVVDAPNDFLRAMIELKDKDPAEFYIKLMPLKKEFERKTAESNARYERRMSGDDIAEKFVPKCPTCGSKDIRKIGVGERAASIGFFGIFSKKINKTWKCQNCGHTW